MKPVLKGPQEAIVPLPSLLGVFAHPDDEALLAGGVLAQHAASGSRTAVVTSTWAPDSHRAAELADATAPWAPAHLACWATPTTASPTPPRTDHDSATHHSTR